jgi:glycerophosphoryl diester phosphodiesterase
MVLRIGHRGAAGHEPENTLRSFERAIGLGTDVVELDVQVCGTGELVVIHDETVNRTTNGSGPVKEMPFKELRALDAGDGERIPTLDEALALLEGKVGVNVELKSLKSAGPAHASVMEALGRPGWGAEDIIFSSFHLGELTELRDLSADARVGVLVSGDPREVLEFAALVDAYSINPNHHRINEEFVEEAHGMGLKVFVWTVNEPGDIERMKGLGVDGIISDYPDRI